MAKINHNQPLTPREIETIKNAEKYTISMFMGRGSYLKYEIKDLEDAVAVGKELSKRENKASMLYAIMGERQALICNFYPDGKVSIRPEK